MFALALAAAMPAAQAIGKSKACDDPVHCFALDVFGDTCQSVREEATTPNGADVALYPQWVPVGEAAGPSLEAGIGLPLGVQLDDPLACWDGCVAHLRARRGGAAGRRLRTHPPRRRCIFRGDDGIDFPFPPLVPDDANSDTAVHD